MNAVNFEAFCKSYLPSWPKNKKEILPCALKALSYLTILAPIGVGLAYIVAHTWNRFHPSSDTHAFPSTTVATQKAAQRVLHVDNQSDNQGNKNTDAANHLPGSIASTQMSTVEDVQQKTDENSKEKKPIASSISIVSKLTALFPVSVSSKKSKEADYNEFDVQDLPLDLTSLKAWSAVPLIQVSTDVVSDLCKEVSDQTSASVAQFSSCRGSGIYMKWKITHINKDPSYSRKGEEKWDEEDISGLQSTLSPIYNPMLFYKNTGYWLSSMPRQDVLHRDDRFDSAWILPEGRWLCHSSEISKQKIEHWKNIESQDDLLSDDSPESNLGWIMSRLLSGQSVCVREWRTDELYRSLEQPAIGYWKIELADAYPSIKIAH